MKITLSLLFVSILSFPCSAGLKIYKNLSEVPGSAELFMNIQTGEFLDIQTLPAAYKGRYAMNPHFFVKVEKTPNGNFKEPDMGHLRMSEEELERLFDDSDSGTSLQTGEKSLPETQTKDTLDLKKTVKEDQTDHFNKKKSAEPGEEPNKGQTPNIASQRPNSVDRRAMRPFRDIRKPGMAYLKAKQKIFLKFNEKLEHEITKAANANDLETFKTLSTLSQSISTGQELKVSDVSNSSLKKLFSAYLNKVQDLRKPLERAIENMNMKRKIPKGITQETLKQNLLNTFINAPMHQGKNPVALFIQVAKSFTKEHALANPGRGKRSDSSKSESRRKKNKEKK